MSDYIKRENVINTIQKADYIGDNESLRLAFEIDDILSADVVPKDFHDKTCEAMAKRHTEEIQRYMWIPCSERLPEKYDYYLVTAKNHKNDDTYLVISWFQGYWFTDAIAIAWMPLPEPYKEDE